MRNHKATQTALNCLLSSDPSAKEFFLLLPDYVQGGLQQQSNLIATAEDLHNRAADLFLH